MKQRYMEGLRACLSSACYCRWLERGKRGAASEIYFQLDDTSDSTSFNALAKNKKSCARVVVLLCGLVTIVECKLVMKYHSSKSVEKRTS